ncbi:Anti-sigma regulatory factor (Ser/Thr protein kinase) [Streptomyces misionensis]|uniref:Anti-sigma regulatory factor (Ser/Thr protein kinase) n=1 Tax=Streptomyces misionensis TaxID=67331 RepID=A0A1H5GS60_9ACTN|nr:ATP-binding protein [Streptomyces misionensis]SEE18334.1 Anti-sigma regulatory factor (Ser/Thr protein kinase) [Streptomyces misionensis]
MAPPSVPRPLHRPLSDVGTDRSSVEDAGPRAPMAARPQRVAEDPHRAASTARPPHRVPPEPAGAPAARGVPESAGTPDSPGTRTPGDVPAPVADRRRPRFSGRSAAGSGLLGSTASFDLPARPTAVGSARRVVRELLTAWGIPQDVRDDALLVTSELVTNALVHAGGDRIACRLDGTADRIRVEVEDEAGDEDVALPVACRPGPDDQHGRGLLLVEALSRGWGVTFPPGRPARVVWAELASV